MVAIVLWTVGFHSPENNDDNMVKAETDNLSIHAVNAPPPGYRDIPLTEGWNLFGLPLIPADSNIESVLAGILDKVISVWGYDTSNTGSPWTSWAPGWGGDLTEMVDCMGYWINMSSTATLRVQGYSGVSETGDKDIPLNENWNLISLPFVPSDSSIEAVLNPIIDNVISVWSYDNTNPGNPWSSWAPVWGGEITDMVDCKGFWINMKSVDTLTCEGISDISTVPFQIHYIDVGQGDSILLDMGEYEVLIDGGRWSDCVNYIVSFIDGPLETIIATHPDADHIGGLDKVLDKFDVEHIWLNGDTSTSSTYEAFMDAVNQEETYGAQVHVAKRGDVINVGGLVFEVLNPELPLSSDTNENSIVLKLSYGQVDFLFTGDAGSAAEASMISAGLITDIDVLKVSHHGSKYCTIDDFLNAVQPEVAIISVGENPYGHPAPETIGRLEGIGAEIYRTDMNGTIIVATDGTTYSVTPSVMPTPTPSPTPSPTSTPSPTPTPTGGASDVQITYIFYDGLVPSVESDEYVEIKNLGNAPQDLTDWVLKDIDEGYPSFTFPSYTLQPGETIRVYTNEIHPEWGGFSFGYGQAIWNNSDPDTAALFDDQAQLVSSMSY